MKHVSTKRYFYGDVEVTKEQAKYIRSVGGRVVSKRDDDYIWRNWR